jgi:hypothetical protein
MKPRPSAATCLALVTLLGGCASAGAPSFVLFGSYFPAWMFCAAVGIMGGVIARTILVARQLTDALPHQLTICAGIGLMVALATWLLFFR